MSENEALMVDLGPGKHFVAFPTLFPDLLTRALVLLSLRQRGGQRPQHCSHIHETASRLQEVSPGQNL